MNVNSLLVFQVITDAIVCAGILFLLVRLRQLFKAGLSEINEESVQKFSRLLDESRMEANRFFEKLEKQKQEMKELAAFLDEKEKRLKNLAGESRHHADFFRAEKTVLDSSAQTDSFSEETYGDILSLARQGLNEEQIAQQSGLPEGEVDLILNLSRAKVE